MVDVISQETRAEALRRARELENARLRLSAQQRKLNSPSAIRSRTRQGLVQAQRTQQTLSQTQNAVNSDLNYLQNIARLPTVEEAGQLGISESDIKIARRIASEPKGGKSIPIAFIRDKNLRRLVVAIREGKTPDQLIGEFESANLISLNPQAKLDLLNNQKLLQAGASLEDIRAGQSLSSVEQVLPQQNNLASDLSLRERLKQRGAERIGELKSLVQSRGVVGLIRDLSRETTRIGIKELTRGPTKEEYLSILFIPAFGIGAAAQESEFVEVRSSTGELKGFKKKPTLKQVEDLSTSVQEFFATKPVTQQREQIREIITRFKDDPIRLRNARNFISKSIGKDLSDRLFADVLSQEGVSLNSAKTNLGVTRGPSKTALPASEAERINNLPTFVGGGGRQRSAFTGQGAEREVSAFSSTRSPLASRQRPTLIPIEQIRQRYRLEQRSLLQSLLSQGLSASQVQKSLQNLRLQQRQDFKQQIKQRQQQRQEFAQRNALGQPQRFQQPQRQVSRFGQPSRFGGRPGGSFAKPIPGKLKFPKPAFGSKRIGTMITGKIPKKYDLFARKGGRLIRINKDPILGANQAKDLLAKKLDTTLRASGIIRPSRRPGFAKIPTEISGYLKKNNAKFYTNPKTGFLVERRSARLERGGAEVRDIKQLKRLPKPFAKRIK